MPPSSIEDDKTEWASRIYDKLGIVVRKADPKDIPHLSLHLRKEDRDEIKAASGSDPEDGIKVCVECGGWVAVDSHPFIIWGNIDKSIWCLATNRIYKYKLSFVKFSSAWLDALDYPDLNCYADSRNTEHHKWLLYNKFKLNQTSLYFYDPLVEFYEYVRRG